MPYGFFGVSAALAGARRVRRRRTLPPPGLKILTWLRFCLWRKRVLARIFGPIRRRVDSAR